MGNGLVPMSLGTLSNGWSNASCAVMVTQRSDSERSSMTGSAILIQYMRVTEVRTTDLRNCRGIYALRYSIGLLSQVKKQCCKLQKKPPGTSGGCSRLPVYGTQTKSSFG